MCSTVRNHCVMPEKFNCTTSMQLGPKNIFYAKNLQYLLLQKWVYHLLTSLCFISSPCLNIISEHPVLELIMSMHIDNPVYLCLVCAGDVLHWCYLIIDLDTERQRETRYSSSTSASVCIHVYNRFTGMLGVLCIRLGQFWYYWC